MVVETAQDQAQLLTDPRLNTTGEGNVVSILSRRNHGLTRAQARTALNIFGKNSFDEKAKPGEGLDYLLDPNRAKVNQMIGAMGAAICLPIYFGTSAIIIARNPELLKTHPIPIVNMGRNGYEYHKFMTYHPDAEKRERRLIEQTGLSYSQLKHGENEHLLKAALQLEGVEGVRAGWDDTAAFISMARKRLAFIGAHPFAITEEESLEDLVGVDSALRYREAADLGVLPGLLGVNHALPDGRKMDPEPRAYLYSKYFEWASPVVDFNIAIRVPLRLMRGALRKMQHLSKSQSSEPISLLRIASVVG